MPGLFLSLMSMDAKTFLLLFSLTEETCIDLIARNQVPSYAAGVFIFFVISLLDKTENV